MILINCCFTLIILKIFLYLSKWLDLNINNLTPKGKYFTPFNYISPNHERHKNFLKYSRLNKKDQWLSLTTQKRQDIRVYPSSCSTLWFEEEEKKKEERKKKKYISRLKVNSTPVYASLCPSLVPPRAEHNSRLSVVGFSLQRRPFYSQRRTQRKQPIKFLFPRELDNLSSFLSLSLSFSLGAKGRVREETRREKKKRKKKGRREEEKRSIHRMDQFVHLFGPGSIP